MMVGFQTVDKLEVLSLTAVFLMQLNFQNVEAATSITQWDIKICNISYIVFIFTSKSKISQLFCM